MQDQTKRTAATLLRLLFSAGLIVWLLRQHVDGAQVEALLRHMDGRLFAGVLALKVGQIVLGSERWRAVLWALGEKVPALFLLRLFWISAFWAQILPGAVGGDLVRTAAAKGAGLSLRRAAQSVLLERAVSLGGLIFFVAAMNFMPQAALLPARWVFPSFAVAGAVAALFALRFDLLGVRALCAAPKLAFAAILLGLVGPLNLSLCAWVLAEALGVTISFPALCVVVPAATLVASLPLSLAGWGVREAAFVAGLGFLGIGADDAMSLSLLYGFAGLLAALPGGLGIVFLKRG